MTLPRTRIWPAVAAVVLIQSAALGWMVWDRVSLLTSGREIALDVIPVDPRDMFRGDYVILGYDISRLPAALVPPNLKYGTRLYVTLERGADEVWTPVAASETYSAPEGDLRVVIAGRLQDGTGAVSAEGATHWIRYGIESYFVPEGEGLAIEAQVRERKIKALVSVGPDGKTALKGLLAGGKLIHAQPVL